jgi:hypothetical protein
MLLINSNRYKDISGRSRTRKQSCEQQWHYENPENEVFSRWLAIDSVAFFFPILLINSLGGIMAVSKPTQILYWTAQVVGVCSMAYWIHPIVGSFRHSLDKVVAKTSFFMFAISAATYYCEGMGQLLPIGFLSGLVSIFFFAVGCALHNAHKRSWVIAHSIWHILVGCNMCLVVFVIEWEQHQEALQAYPIFNVLESFNEKALLWFSI